MHVLTRPKTTPRSRLADDLRGTMTPRRAAIRLLREKIAAGKAGLDPYCTPDFIIEAGPNEITWVNRCASLTGVILLRMPQVGGGERFRVVLEADVRDDLGLDAPNPPLMADPFVAVRRATELLMDAAIEAIEDATDKRIASLGLPRPKPVAEAVSLDAAREAKAAYDLRYPNGPDPQLVIRTDNTDGAA